jgi:hypothetical protein
LGFLVWKYTIWQPWLDPVNVLDMFVKFHSNSQNNNSN